MAAQAEGMKAMRARRRDGSLREVRLGLPDARTRAVARLDPAAEADALAWIESVSEFDEPQEDAENPPR